MRKILATLLIAVVSLTILPNPLRANGSTNGWMPTGEETLTRQPILATSLGDPRYNGQLVDDTTPAWRAENRRYLQRQLQQLRVLTPSAGAACLTAFLKLSWKRSLRVVVFQVLN